MVAIFLRTIIYRYAFGENTKSISCPQSLRSSVAGGWRDTQVQGLEKDNPAFPEFGKTGPQGFQWLETVGCRLPAFAKASADRQPA